MTLDWFPTLTNFFEQDDPAIDPPDVYLAMSAPTASTPDEAEVSEA